MAPNIGRVVVRIGRKSGPLARHVLRSGARRLTLKQVGQGKKHRASGHLATAHHFVPDLSSFATSRTRQVLPVQSSAISLRMFRTPAVLLVAPWLSRVWPGVWLITVVIIGSRVRSPGG